MTANTGASAGHAGPSVLIAKEATAFSIGSMNSEGMLSDNPKSGIHETTVARTIDANGSNPAGYQGGDLIVIKKNGGGGKRSEYVAGFQNTGRGWWNQCDTAETLRTPCGGDSMKANLVLTRKSSS